MFSDIAPLLEQFEDVICLHLVAALVGYASCSSILRDLLALLCHFGGMGIFIPWILLILNWFAASVKVTAHSCKAI